jgi:serine protease
VSAGASETVPGEVVVKFRAGATAAAAARGPEPVGHPRTLRVRSVPAALRRLRARADVVYAVPNVKARIAGFVPNDPGRGKTPGRLGRDPVELRRPVRRQRARRLAAHDRARPPRRPRRDRRVLDTGVAYRARRGFLQSPDLTPSRFVQGYDFVDGDPYANDRNGHGTHVASTIAERTGNGYGLTGLAYNATIMPVRVLDDRGEGDAAAIARGVRWAARRGAHVINLSLEFGTEVQATRSPSCWTRSATRTAGARSSSGPRATTARRRSPTPPGPRTSWPSAPPRSTAACPRSPTRARGWTSWRPAAARTRRWPTIPPAPRTSARAGTSRR